MWFLETLMGEQAQQRFSFEAGGDRRRLSITLASVYGFDAHRSAARSARDLAGALARRGHHVHFVCPRAAESGPPVFEAAPHFKVHRVEQGGIAEPLLRLARFLPVVRRSGIDIGAESLPNMLAAVESLASDVVLASPPPGPAFWSAFVVQQKTKKPVFLLPSETMVDEWLIHTPVTHRLLHGLHHIVTNPFDRATLRDAGCDENRLHVVAPFIATEEAEYAAFNEPVTAAPHELAARFGIGAYPTVGFVGRQSAESAIDTLIDAMSAVWRELPDVQLLLAGEPTAERDVALARLLQAAPQLRTRVICIDRFDEADRASVFALCDVVACSQRRDPLARSALETWHAKRVPVGDPLGGGWLISHNQTGLFASSGSAATLARALMQLLADKPLRDNMASEGRRRMMRLHTAEKAAETVEGLLLAALA